MPSAHCGFTSISVVMCAVTRAPGEVVAPTYVAVQDFQTAAENQIGMPKLGALRCPPYPTGPQALLVTIDAQDLLGLHLALDWRMPERIIDIAVEFRNLVNGTPAPAGHGFAGALVWFGLTATPAILRGTDPGTVRCKLHALRALFEKMTPTLDWGRALLRGRYLGAVARMETVGLPVDTGTLTPLTANWATIKPDLIKVIDRKIGVYRDSCFQPKAFSSFLKRRQIDWPRSPNGSLDLSDDVFRERARAHAELRSLKELRATLATFEPEKLAIGRDGRNRTPLRPFQSRTGRNQPSSKSWLLGSPAWTRNLIRPSVGKGLVWIDWAQQEFGIAAALSCDKAMQAAYHSGDPYLATAIKTNAAPADATRSSHGDIRGQYKACALGIQYGMGAATLARSLCIGAETAKTLIRDHRSTYSKFWWWSNKAEQVGLLTGELQSVFGWRVNVGSNSNSRFLRNFPIQANGAEMLRLACCMITEADIKVCAPLHDALLIEAPLENLAVAVVTAERLMAEASAIVLDGFVLRTDITIVRTPDRLSDSRGTAIWNAIQDIIQGHFVSETSEWQTRTRAHPRDVSCSNLDTRTVSLYVSNGDSSNDSI